MDKTQDNENPALPILRHQLKTMDKNIGRLQAAREKLVRAIQAIEDLPR